VLSPLVTQPVSPCVSFLRLLNQTRHGAQDAKVTLFALKMRVSATHVVQQVEEFLTAAKKALDTLSGVSEKVDTGLDDE